MTTAAATPAKDPPFPSSVLSSLDGLIKRSQLETAQLLGVLELLKTASETQQGVASHGSLLGLLDLEVLKKATTKPAESPPPPSSPPPPPIKEEPDISLGPIISLPEPVLSPPHSDLSPTTLSPKRKLDLSSDTTQSSPKRPRPEDQSVMVLVPIRASFLRSLLNSDPDTSISVTSILTAIGDIPDTDQQGSSPSPSSPSSPSAAAASAAVLRFCERRSNPHSVDVFHYLPADSKVSPFLKSPTPASSQRRTLLDELTSTVVARPGRGRPPVTPTSTVPPPAIFTPPVSTIHHHPSPALAPPSAAGLNERTNYTPVQTERLEAAFAINNFLSKDHRERLSRELGIHPSRIKVWYQNRRARRKREDLLKEKIAAAARQAAQTESET